MKKLRIFAIFAAMLLLVGCGEKATPVQRFAESGGIASDAALGYALIGYDAYHADGELDGSVRALPGLLHVKNVSYTEDGSECYWEYDKNGNELSVRTVTNGIEKIAEYEYEYYDGGRKAIKYCIDGDERIKAGEVAYDGKGRETAYAAYLDDGEIDIRITKYDGDIIVELIKGSGVPAELYDGSDGIKLPDGNYMRDTHRYDKDGRLVQWITSNGTKETEHSYTNEYDSTGRLVRYDYKNILEEKNYHQIYEYDNQGRLIKETSYDHNGEVSNVREWEYLSDDTFVLINSDGGYEMKYKLDKAGNVVEIWDYDPQTGEEYLWRKQFYEKR